MKHNLINQTLYGVYAAKLKDLESRLQSQSGGLFVALSDYVLSCGGVVYGVVLTENLICAMHMRAENSQQRDMMRGSKYIQSELRGTFIQAKQDLEQGRLVLFSGTSCQIAGLNNFLAASGTNYDNLLLTVDIICHGVPSPLVWSHYLDWQSTRLRTAIVKADFRNKRKFGWGPHTETLYGQGGEEIDSNVFRNIFYGHNVLRPCCFECPFKSIYHPADITIGDCWGIRKAAPDFSSTDDYNGVSIVMLNSKLGMECFEKIKETLFFADIRIEDAMQEPLIAPYTPPKTRDKFWNDFHRKKFLYIARKYGDYGFFNQVKRFCIRALNKIKRLLRVK